jgi:hypothetical protein
MAEAHNHEQVDVLRRELFGRSVVAVKMVKDAGRIDSSWGPDIQGEVTLDNGRVLQLAGNGPECACSAGEYDLTQLNDMPINGITDVQVVEETRDANAGNDYLGQVYRLFVLAQDDRIELATFEGDDGNGYYGTGFWFRVVNP